METNGRKIEFRYATGRDLVDEAKLLFVEYARSLDTDLCFQDFQTELETLPGKYAPPGGALILAYIGSCAAGCAALRKLSDEVCEMKRLFVRDAYKGLGIGRGLAEKIIEEAAKLHYRFIRLDTLPSMKKAQELYRSLGFYDIGPYVYNPVEGARYMELKL
ncbi:MAG: putative N-acetyltransferase YsnE [Firmicutes bacterium ADurb.Bin182]|nr:MAG: putative N-acetyltransferase YsnE [Firmicutes bacterium ADurb.Bin182]